MKTNYEPVCGSTILDACKEAVSLAIKSGEPVRFSFNDTEVEALPDSVPAVLAREWLAKRHEEAESWRMSPEGQESANDDLLDIREKQAKVDALLIQLPNLISDERALVEWVGAFTDPADRVGVRYDKKALALVMNAAGYHAGDACNLTKAAYRHPNTFAHYIIGNVLSCLESGMGPHPVTTSFVEQYLALKP